MPILPGKKKPIPSSTAAHRTSCACCSTCRWHLDRYGNPISRCIYGGPFLALIEPKSGELLGSKGPNF